MGSIVRHVVLFTYKSFFTSVASFDVDWEVKGHTTNLAGKLDDDIILFRGSGKQEISIDGSTA